MYTTTHKILKDSIEKAVECKEKITRRKLFSKGIKVVECSSCKLNMKESTALEQIKNNRENAPICVACILGWTRNKEKGNRTKSVMDDITNKKKSPYKKDTRRDREKELDKISNR